MRLFRRRSGGFSPILFVFEAMGLFMACAAMAFGVPASFMRARGVRSLPQPVPGVLVDGRMIEVQFPRSVGMQNVEDSTTDQVNNGAVERQTKGYLPGQMVAIEGRWEGDDLLTAAVVYGGSIDEFVEATGRAPYQIAIFSVVCLFLSFGMLGGGVALRFLGR